MTIRIGSIRGGAFAIGDNATVVVNNPSTPRQRNREYDYNFGEFAMKKDLINNSALVVKCADSTFVLTKQGGLPEFGDMDPIAKTFRVEGVLIQYYNGSICLEGGAPLKEDSLQHLGVEITIS